MNHNPLTMEFLNLPLYTVCITFGYLTEKHQEAFAIVNHRRDFGADTCRSDLQICDYGN